MAIEIGSVASVQPTKPGGGRASGREAPAGGEGSFASALSASSAAPAPASAPAPAPSRSATKKPEANDRGQDSGAGIDDSVDAAGGDTATDADALQVAAAPGAATGEPLSSTQPQPLPLSPQQTASLPVPGETALMLAQSALAGTAAHDPRQRAPAVTAAGALPAAMPPATLPSTEAAPVIAAGHLPNAVAQQSAAGLQAADAASPEPEAALQALSARSVGVRATPAATAGAAGTSAADPFVAPAASATSALAASFSSALPQQMQRAVVQAQAQTVADRAALQAPNATATLDSRAAESIAAAGMASGASVDASASPLLRRFERVLSMTHAASGESQAAGSGGATAAPAWMTPVSGTAAGAGASMGGMADRLADSMNGLLAQVVTQKNHNASLTVDVGGQPVSVNVQVQGNEAQVVFRADQAETRAMLAQALPQLRQMMGAEGLVLSDASVVGQWAGGGAQAGAGASGGSDGSGGGGTGDAEARRATSAGRIDTGGPVAGATAATASRSQGARALDLYV